MECAELAAWLRLMLTPGLGGTGVRRLLAAFGPPEAIFAQSEAALCTALGHARAQDQARALMDPPADWHEQTERTWAWLQADLAHRAIVTLADVDAEAGPRYPTPLLHIEDPPPLLYLSGRLDRLQGDAAHDAWDMAQHIAIVGSRNPTPQGLLNARQFAQALHEAGLAIVSGLALGIDGAAHEGALDGALGGAASSEEIATIAVTGTGLDIDYPRSHKALAQRILERGLIVSEYALGTPPLAPNFPRRNRIIAGLSCATLVVEAATQSGSLITARLASEQGRDVFAIPGSIHSTQSRGCHALIKQGAKLVESVSDILEELSGRTVATPTTPRIAASAEIEDPGEDETPLLAALGTDPVSLDALQARTGLPIAQLQAQLTVLELEGRVARLPGGLLQRLADG